MQRRKGLAATDPSSTPELTAAQCRRLDKVVANMNCELPISFVELSHWCIRYRSADGFVLGHDTVWEPVSNEPLKERDYISPVASAFHQAFVASLKRLRQAKAAKVFPLTEPVHDARKTSEKLWHVVDRARRLCKVLALASELPPNWELADDLTLPPRPVRNIPELAVHLKVWHTILLEQFRLRMTSPSRLADFQRELRNARRAVRCFIEIPANRPGFDDNPVGFHDVERQLELLIDRFSSGDVDSKAAANIEPPKSIELKACALPSSTNPMSTPYEMPALSEKAYLILETMMELKALSADTRRKAEQIAYACDGNSADINVFKPLLSALTKSGLTQSKTGSGGGSWLTPQGVQVVNSLLENRHMSKSKR